MSAQTPFDLIVAGVGGQGSLFASKVLAEAAFRQGLTVRVAETYGVAQRGGAVYSQIRIGYPVCGPMIPKGSCPLILGLEPIEALRRATGYLAPKGVVVLNSQVNEPLETKMGRQPAIDLATICRELDRLGAGRVLTVDALDLARSAGGVPTLNVIMLGVLLSLDIFPLTYESIAKAVATVGKPAYTDKNLASLALGQKVGREMMKDEGQP